MYLGASKLFSFHRIKVDFVNSNDKRVSGINELLRSFYGGLLLMNLNIIRAYFYQNLKRSQAQAKVFYWISFFKREI